MLDKLWRLRQGLEKVFARDTAAPGWTGKTPSTGHCAAVAVLVQRLLGGEIMTATVAGESHWFNHIDDKDVDLTGDQFGHGPMQIGNHGGLYARARVRKPEEVRDGLLARVNLLQKRLDEIFF